MEKKTIKLSKNVEPKVIRSYKELGYTIEFEKEVKAKAPKAEAKEVKKEDK